MEKISQKENQITFVTEIGETLANAIRRYINQIPTLAIDEVEISRNDSPLYDETVAHRLGLVPLKTDKNVSEKTEKELSLAVKKEGVVYSGDLDGNVKIVFDKIPITHLNKNQELKLTASVKAGTGSEHARFSPGLMFYRNVFDVKVDKDCPLEVVEICPQKILANDNGKISVTDSGKCDMCEACLEICKKKGKGSIKIEPTKELKITVESFGQMDVKDVFNKAVEILKKDLKEISKELK